MSALALGAAFGCGAVAPRRSLAIRRARVTRVRVVAVASGSEGPGSAPAGNPSARARANLLATLADAESADAKAKKAKKGKKAKKAGTASADGPVKKSGEKSSGAAKTQKKSAASSTTSRRASTRSAQKPEWEVLHFEQPYIKTPRPTRRPWTAYPWDKPGVAGGPPKELDELRWSPNGNALMQIDRQTIPYNQFVKDLLLKDQIREIHWKRDGHDRYLIIYNDDRVGYVQVPQDDWITTDLINKQPGLRVHEITEEGERDASTGEYISAGDTSAQLFTQYGVPLIGVGVVWFIVWTMNRFKGDFDDRQKMLELERREEAMSKVENDQKLVALKTQLSLMDPTKSAADKALYEKTETELEVLRAKLQARARFAVSEEGGGPGGGQGVGGQSGEEAVSGFMKVDGMKVIGKRDVDRADDGEPADAVAEAMAAARRAKEEDDARARRRSQNATDNETNEQGLSTTMAGATAAQTAAIDERAEKEALRKKEERKQGKLRSKMKMRDESEIVKFSDVAGIGDAKIELAEIVDFFRKPEKFKLSGANVPKGVMLTGPPGCGKTLLARAVAGEAGVPFFYRAGSEFEEMFVGVGSKRVRQLFKAAKAKMPCIIFIDEIDAVGTSRKAFETQSRKTLNQLLTEMDGFEQNEGIIVIAATNIPEQLDPALTRPGRFDRLVHVPNPDIGGRREILRHYLLNKPVADDVDVESIARGTSGFSGAELFNLVNMAAVQAAVSGETAISLERLEWAKDRIIMGVERKSAVLTEESKKLTAYHEAGHAIVALRTPGAMPVHKATIVPRGNALGMVTQLPDKDETSITRKQLLARLDVCMGGRVAEELIFGKDEVTTGALSDLQQATRLATYMVGEVGLSALVGPVHVDSMSKGGRRATEALVDKEVVQLLRDSHARVTKLLTRHTADLHALSAEMIAKETLTGPEIVQLLGLEPKPGDKQSAGRRGSSAGRRGAPDDKREKVASVEKAKEAKAKAKEGEEEGGARAGGDDLTEPDGDAIPAGILEPVEDRAKASTAA